MAMIDFGELKRSLLVLDVIALTGWQPRPRESGSISLRGACPLRQHTRDGHARLFSVTGPGWYCHGCRLGGDAVDLWCRLTGKLCGEAAIDLCRRLGREVPRVTVTRGTGKRHG